MIELTDLEFDLALNEAMDNLPPRLAEVISGLGNVAVLVEDRYVPGPGEDPDLQLWGVYEGVPLTERTFDSEIGALPDAIILFKETFLQACETYDDVVDEIITTIVHEAAHHFGISDARLHELGWG
ncbi:metallopeptidase family protein [Falsarthrobacter nasiphocae]|uniref:Zn-dependent protease with MMP-like domain n=1 Tax=Falsarthrobacter nasiphocae TaxID=189863 RepID=A0AAE3YH92_9MICC|nr:metallopeptidase family protein [Falsarthrobacter nasiphocae]MDR6891898.1 putative Zn-dependent protease with MMP-like domain [Falsarthrobacter nasiphocae]